MKKIIEKKVIDITHLNYEELANSELIYELFVNYKLGGGNLDNLINYQNDKPLLTLKEFCDKKGLTEKGVVEKLLNNGAMSLFCDFIYNENTKQIFEKKEFGLNWMASNWSDNREQENIKKAINNLIQNLPDNYKELKSFNSYNSYDNSFTEHKEPILFMFSKFPNAYFLEQLIEKKPGYKDYFDTKIQTTTNYLNKAEKYDTYIVQAIIESNNKNHNTTTDISLKFYENDIGLKYFHDVNQSNKLHELILQGVKENNITFVSKVVKKINLKEIEKNLYNDSLSLSKAKTKEMAEILINAGAPDSNIVKFSGEEVVQYAIFNEYQKSIETFKVILDAYPEKYKKLFESGKMNALFEKKDEQFLKYVLEKFNIDISKIDMLNWANKIFRENKNIDIYSYIQSKGANFDICHSFIEKAVIDRDDGLKRIRALNKEKVLDTKSPAFIHEVLKNKPTKTFLSYYDKLTEIELNKEDSLQRLAWWGCQRESEFFFVKTKVKNLKLENNEGKTYFHYLLENRLKIINYAQNSEKNLCEIIIKKYKSIERNEPIDWSYKDESGNNLLHLVFDNKEYYKTEVSNELIKELINNNLITHDDINKLLTDSNNKGLFPLDILDLAVQVKASNYKSIKGLEDFYKIMKENLNLMSEMKKGLTFGEFLYETVKDEELKKEIHMNMLNQILPNKDNNKRRNKL